MCNWGQEAPRICTCLITDKPTWHCFPRLVGTLQGENHHLLLGTIKTQELHCQWDLLGCCVERQNSIVVRTNWEANMCATATITQAGQKSKLRRVPHWFNSQHPYDGSQPSITPVLRDPMHAYKWHINLQAGKTSI